MSEEKAQEEKDAPQIKVSVNSDNEMSISTNLPAMLAISLLSAAIDSIATQELGEGADVGEIEQ